MIPSHKNIFRFLSLLLLLGGVALPAAAGVSRAVQQEYRERYENKAMVLKVPLYGDRQTVRITGPGYRVEPGSGTPRFKVGDQLRVMEVSFSGDQVRFRLSPVTTSETVELSFQFDAGLEDDFPNRKVFDQALGAVLTEGLRYTEIDDARRQFVTGHFERSVRELAEAASISRDAALEQIAPLLPAYQQAKRETASLEERLRKISAQLEAARGENRELQSQVGNLEAESSRLKRSSSELEQRMRASSSQISRLGEELRAAQGTAQGYQKELAEIQRSLNLKAEAGKDLSRQIAELGRALRTLQGEKETLTGKVASLEKELASRAGAPPRRQGQKTPDPRGHAPRR
jgi:CII-binding regulator of phage lambda lysogenization HflD